MRTFKGEDDDGKNIEEGDGADNHERRHTGRRIHIVDESQSENGGAAPIGGLNKSALLGLFFHKQLGKPPDAEDDYERAQKAEKNIVSLEAASNIIFGQILENQDGKRYGKDIFIGGICEGIVDNVQFMQNLSQYHHEKYRQGCVYAV